MSGDNKSSNKNKRPSVKIIILVILGLLVLCCVITFEIGGDGAYEEGKNDAHKYIEEQQKSSNANVLDYEVVETEESIKGGSYDFVLQEIVLKGDPEVRTKEDTQATLEAILDNIKDTYKPDGVTVFVYNDEGEIGKGYTVAKIEWWPKGHTFDPDNKSNIEDKSTYETIYDIRDITKL